MNGYVAYNPKHLRNGSRAEIRGLALLPRRGMLEMLLFLAVSTAFFCIRNVDLLTPLAENVRQVLGCPPPLTLITVAVAGYTVSAALYAIGQMIGDARPALKWTSLFYRTIFYLFYAVANALPVYFMGVFVAGLLLYTLEQLHVWMYCLRVQPETGSLFGKR